MSDWRHNATATCKLVANAGVCGRECHRGCRGGGPGKTRLAELQIAGEECRCPARAKPAIAEEFNRDPAMIQRRPGAVIWHLIDSRTIGGAERHIVILLRCLSTRSIAAQAVLYRNYGSNPWLSQLSAADLPFRVLHGSFRSL